MRAVRRLLRGRAPGAPLRDDEGRESQSYSVALPAGQIGLVLEIDEDTAQPTVCEVLDQSPLRGRVEVGDVLTHIDRQSIGHLSLGGVLKRCREIRRRRKELTFLYGYGQ